jgi:phosphoribosylglycinamide formyltransferase-1
MKRIAIFVSGGGSNAQKIMEHFKSHPLIQVGLVVSNKKYAGVFKYAEDFNVPYYYLSKDQISDPLKTVELLEENNIFAIVLAGYLKKIPIELIQAFPNRVLNIHPSLLPKYGGKGMYGINVHRAVKENGDKVSGPTIHLVNEEYDKGKILFQKEIDLADSDLPEDIAAKVLKIEHSAYYQVIDEYLTKL